MDIIDKHQTVICRVNNFMTAIILNRPDFINSLNIEMIESITDFLSRALENDRCRFILFYGSGNKGFCAGGDVKELARKADKKLFDEVNLFFKKEYELDLMIHQYPKPVIVIADGVTMGGGLGIAAGADIVLATERTRMAMPESRIGFFPDVGATGWLFSRCPKGYPEYLSLTGYETRAEECVRIGLATHFIMSRDISKVISALENYEPDKKMGRKELSLKIQKIISPYINHDIPANKNMDDWVAQYFAGKSDLNEIINSLEKCVNHKDLCENVFDGIAARSPTALVLTLKLLRHNEGRPIADVFSSELRAAEFMTRQPDYLEGVRARLIEKDDTPRWQPDKIEQVNLAGLKL
ncbi:MAG: enoyl-CoA hydratase/isomerase family protein [Syntrophaceae bacterium]|nr:enoyl-CoA hydratase/isomerase family protein [Syntrophaceae bacterium]